MLLLGRRVTMDPNTNLDHRTKDYKDLVKMTPKTEEVLSEKIDGEIYSYKRVPQCKVCRAPDEISGLVDTLLLFPKSYKEVLEFIRPIEERLEIDTKDRISYDSIRIHQKRHLPFDKIAVREVVERRAQEKNLKVLDDRNILTQEALYEVIVAKGFEDIIHDRVRPTMAQTMLAAEALAKLEEKQNQQFRPEALINQLNTIVTAMREVLPPDMMQAVSDKIEELQRNPSPIPGEVIDQEELESGEEDEYIDIPEPE